MVIFNSYVKLPEGIPDSHPGWSQSPGCCTRNPWDLWLLLTLRAALFHHDTLIILTQPFPPDPVALQIEIEEIEVQQLDGFSKGIHILFICFYLCIYILIYRYNRSSCRLSMIKWEGHRSQTVPMIIVTPKNHNLVPWSIHNGNPWHPTGEKKIHPAVAETHGLPSGKLT